MKRNYVSKYSGRINKSQIHRDRKKDYNRQQQKRVLTNWEQ